MSKRHTRKSQLRRGRPSGAVRFVMASGWPAVLLIGLPVALVFFAGSPLPRRIPTRQQWADWLLQPLAPHMVVTAVVWLMWFAWSLLLWTVCAELSKRVGR